MTPIITATDEDLARMLADQHVDHQTTWHQCSSPGCMMGCRKSEWCARCLRGEIRRRERMKE